MELIREIECSFEYSCSVDKLNGKEFGATFAGKKFSHERESGCKMSSQEFPLVTGEFNDELTDLLNRQEFVDRLVSIAETLSANKKNACYAINGEWGVGKTFVIDILEKQLRNIGQEEIGRASCRERV